MNLSRTEREVLSAFAAAVERLVGDDCVDMVLFGSRARGEGHDQSDLDVLVRVRGLTRDGRRALQDAAHDATQTLGFSLNPCVVNDQSWPASAPALAVEIERDGVRLAEVLRR